MGWIEEVNEREESSFSPPDFCGEMKKNKNLDIISFPFFSQIRVVAIPLAVAAL